MEKYSTLELFDGTHYLTWVTEAEMYLRHKGYFEVIEEMEFRNG